MTEMKQQELVLENTDIGSTLEAIDQLDDSTCILKGVSDLLAALSDQPHDHHDAMRMLSDVTFHQSQNVEKIREFIESDFTASSVQKSTSNLVEL